MSNMGKYLDRFLILSVVFLCFVRLIYSILVKSGGDEVYFVEELNFIHQLGWFEATQNGICVTNSLIAYPLSLIFEPFMALRITSFLVTAAALFYFYKRFYNVKYYFWYLLFFVGSSFYFFIGTNDALFTFLMSIVLLESYLAITQKEKKYLPIILSLIVISFFTRIIFLVYLPTIFLIIYFFIKLKLLNIKQFIAPLLITIILLGLNVSALSQNNVLSYEIKEPKKDGITWIEMQYLSQLKINQGEIKENYWVSWESVEEYKKENGENALPQSVSESIFFDINLTIKEFFKDFIFSNLKLIRNTSGIILISFLIVLLNFKNSFKQYQQYLLHLFFILSSLTFSFIIINNLEIRWLGLVVIPIIFMYCIQSKHSSVVMFNTNILQYLLKFNKIGVILFSVYDIYRMYHNYLNYGSWWTI